MDNKNLRTKPQRKIGMIMSEGNKLPVLSLEVKTLIDPMIKRYSVTLRAYRNALRKKNKQELVFTREEKSMLIIG